MPVSFGEKLAPEHGIGGYRQIRAQFSAAARILEEKAPGMILLIGGDCGTDVAPIAYLNRKYRGDLAIVWLDVHGDLNSPASSATHNFHGMPLRFLLKNCRPGFVEAEDRLQPAQVFLAGVLDLDPPEAEYVAARGNSLVPAGELKTDPASVLRLIERKSYSHVYVHVDLDILDTEKYLCLLCPCPDGLDETELMAV